MEKDEKHRKKKRQKINSGEAFEGSSQNEKDPLASLLVGDDFVTSQQQEELEAQKRREKRRERLRKVAAEEQQQPLPATKMTASDRGGQSTKPQGDGQLKIAAQSNDEEKDPYANSVDEDGFDMFSSSVSPEAATKPATAAAVQPGGQAQGDWDDAEGYYKAVIGETIRLNQPTTTTLGQTSNDQNRAEICFSVAGVVGKGVFSTVLKCFTTSNTSSIPIPKEVALKLIRHNESMAKASMVEIRTLIRLSDSPGIVPLLLPTSDSRPLEHRGHVVLAFPYVESCCPSYCS